jgi:WD40 repeat protein
MALFFEFSALRLMTAGADRSLSVWDLFPEDEGPPTKLLQLHTPAVVGRILADNSHHSGVFLLGTSSGTILELDLNVGEHELPDPLDLLQAPFARPSAVAAHPSLPIFAVASFDRYVRVFDSVNHNVEASFKLMGRGTSVNFSPTGEHIAIGLSSGSFLVLCVTSTGFHVLLQQRVLKTADNDSNSVSSSSSLAGCDEVTVLKYSPDNQWLAVACRDYRIYLFLVFEDYSRAAVLKGHSAVVNNLDWSADASALVSVDSAREILYWKMSPPRQDKEAYARRDTPWHSWSCLLGWPVHGIFPSGETSSKAAVGSDVLHCVDRSHRCKECITGDDAGQVM